MVKKYAANNQAYDGQMARAVEAVAVDKVPVAEGSNSYSIYPAPVGGLRKALFDHAQWLADEGGHREEMPGSHRQASG